MAKKKTAKSSASKTDRNDPKQNKSLAIRMVLRSTPKAKPADVVATVKKTYGLEVTKNMVYMIKAKRNIAAGGKKAAGNGAASNPMTSPALWVDAIKLARQLLKATGSVDNAIALLNAVEG
jgi:hypothetical protein